jgi:hypothetical protein
MALSDASLRLAVAEVAHLVACAGVGARAWNVTEAGARMWGGSEAPDLS